MPSLKIRSSGSTSPPIASTAWQLKEKKLATTTYLIYGAVGHRRRLRLRSMERRDEEDHHQQVMDLAERSLHMAYTKKEKYTYLLWPAIPAERTWDGPSLR
jgi:uncharacterized protein YebE (UPF0316 family)